MLRAAGTTANGLRPTLADLRRLPLRDGCCALVIAYYSLQHLHRDELPLGLAELRRVLRHDGVLAIATHLGDGDVFIDEFLGHRITTVGGALYRREELLDALTSAGFDLEHEQQRPPLPHEHDSQRIYLIARRTVPQ
jgi:SAM-dependent methyltransferase